MQEGATNGIRYSLQLQCKSSHFHSTKLYSSFTT